MSSDVDATTRLRKRRKASWKQGEVDGLYHQLSDEMRWSLMEFALSTSSEVRKSELKALERQREEKQRKQETLRRKKLLAAQSEYADALMYIEMFHSPACWRTARDIMRNFNKLRSETAQREAMKEQIRIRVIGLGWKDLHHAWSKNGIAYLAVVLRDYLIKTILAEEKKRSIPKMPPVVLPSRVDRGKLGTMSADYDLLKKHDEDEKRLVMEGGARMRERSEDDGAKDRHERMQPPRPNMDGALIDRRMEQRWDFKEPNGKSSAYVV